MAIARSNTRSSSWSCPRFFEFVLYRLVSRLGMHISKIAAEHEAVRLFLIAHHRRLCPAECRRNLLSFSRSCLPDLNCAARGISGVPTPHGSPASDLAASGFDGRIPARAAGYGRVLSHTMSLRSLLLLVLDHRISAQHQEWSKRIMGGPTFLGISGWLYYQIVPPFYGLIRGSLRLPRWSMKPIVSAKRMMVLASILVFWAYGRGVSFRTRIRQQRRRADLFHAAAESLFRIVVHGLFSWVV